ncbi:DUF6786 family protein [Autumnicola musiva]|uniref:DUF6786 family protein n=1 Tax=Autumnicola musiva TaxID=3075589 RepID=A0ABU3DAE5_9FLAO|nr:DUF6786 family protein [Zunongwangia sp. F117]MDT0678508.1 DUF6786 family protein [Zunongwangia sp. F117]
MRYSTLLKAISISFLISCGNQTKQEEKGMQGKTFEKGSLGYDLEFLKEKDQQLITLSQDSSYVIISPKYQGKVFTSSASGKNGRSFGWINYEAFDGEEDPHMNAYGGENRFWLGPEGSKFSLFFMPNSEMTFENWKTPAAVDTESWEVTDKSSKRVAMQKQMSLVNYAGTSLNIKATRDISILDKQAMEELLNVQVNNNVEGVGFKTENTITNSGENPWTEETGAPCIWILDMFTPSEETVIVIPYNEDAEGKVATTDYFGQIPDERINYDGGKLFFKADGKSRGKLGIPPQRAKTTAGSYDALNKILTITLFEVDNGGVYLNQEWTPEKDPLAGDAVNAYNDGPLEDDSQMGPFYEIESVSPAAFLKPDEKLTHQHSVFHFTGNEEQLDQISQAVLGVSLEEIKNAFQNKNSTEK